MGFHLLNSINFAIQEDNFKEDNFKEDNFKEDNFKEDNFKEDNFKENLLFVEITLKEER